MSKPIDRIEIFCHKNVIWTEFGCIFVQIVSKSVSHSRAIEHSLHVFTTLSTQNIYSRILEFCYICCVLDQKLLFVPILDT